MCLSNDALASAVPHLRLVYLGITASDTRGWKGQTRREARAVKIRNIDYGLQQRELVSPDVLGGRERFVYIAR